MTGSLHHLLAAALIFVASHFLLASRPLRQPLVEAIGEGLFRALYSVVALATLVWMIRAFNRAPYVELWEPGLRLLPMIFMPVALFLVLAGLTTRNPTSVGGERLVDGGPEDPAPGILRITRHPFLWGVVLWGAVHFLAKADAASLIFFGGFIALSLGGMVHIDRKREGRLGAAWGPLRMTTSLLPFAALLSGRTTMDWAGIGWWRPLAALALYAALMHFHVILFGVSPLP